MKNLLLVTLLVGAAVAALFGIGPRDEPASAQLAATGQPVLVELFTSQGCSSCPPADQLLSKLDTGGGVVALSRPVTYWDRLGWKDTLARPANDDLQRRYAQRGLPGGGVYTPEAVVQGTTATVGSDERALRGLIAKARSKDMVELTQSGNKIAASRAVAGAELRFIAVAHNRGVQIANGENGGRRIGYTNVVLNEVATACAPSTPCTATLPAAIAGQRGADRWAAVLQDSKGGKIHAVRWIRPAAK